jgi:Ni,Fe-hydrogenase III large subunit/Ni,Fe-hydrogenase III component G
MTMQPRQLMEEIERRWAGQVRCTADPSGRVVEARCERGVLAPLSSYAYRDASFAFAGLIVEEHDELWRLRYVYYGGADATWLHVLLDAPVAERIFPSIAAQAGVSAADWHEREAEDFFGLQFEGHPRLGDFILHDDAWQEGVEPMRPSFDAAAALRNRRPAADWRPTRIVYEPGAFVMPVGPKFSGISESVHFLLESVGEDVISSTTRLFYKWRAIEKLAEGKTVDEALVLAERFAATTAFAHGLAFCRAVESLAGAAVPERARALRIFLAELERLRHHAGAIEEICASTALAVASSQAGILEEELLRVCGALTGHRYLFGLLVVGGLQTDLPAGACRDALERAADVVARMETLREQLRVSSSFLDRLEQVGIIAPELAARYSLAGPVARASGVARDLRRAQPYSGYERVEFDVPVEHEGDGYARLRVLFAEARESLRIMRQAVERLQEGAVCETPSLKAGAGLGWAEAPRGATFHWVRIGAAGRVARYHPMTPSFANWHSFNLAAEKFAFQDFPIILSTFDLSVAENDR